MSGCVFPVVGVGNGEGGEVNGAGNGGGAAGNGVGGAANGVGGAASGVGSQNVSGQANNSQDSTGAYVQPAVTFHILQKEEMLDLQYFKNKMEELKSENRKSKIMAEKARHRSPQVKRSIGVMMGLKFDLEDVKEDITRIVQLNKSNADLMKILRLVIVWRC